ncbi:MAG TPA: hypothetical protein VI522_00900 [Gammaproteobacteria bacterium]|nr:hypothetical protein [Gammaproteobacteria bacterium]
MITRALLCLLLLFPIIATANQAVTTQPTASSALSTPQAAPTTGGKSVSTSSSKINVPDAATIPGTTENIMKRLDKQDQRINSLEQHIQRIETQLSNLNNSVSSAQKQPKGPVCSADGKSSTNPNTKMSESCKAYRCNEVTGLCRTSCSSTEHCAVGTHVCNLGTGVCIAAG